MEVAKVFETGRSQAVRIPKKFRFQTDEVVVQKLGHALIMVPKEHLLDTFQGGIAGFTEDIFPEAEDRLVQEEGEDR